jgi:hypothetical protein
MPTKDKEAVRVKGKMNEVPHTKQSKDEQFIQKLAALKQKDPVQDAQRAIAKGNKKFIVKAGRGLIIPGIDANQYSMLKTKCGLDYKQGLGDVLYGEHHRRYYSALFAYAKTYNQTMLNACKG